MLRLEDEKFKLLIKKLQETDSATRKVYFSKKMCPNRFLAWWYFYYSNEFVTLLADFHYEWIEAMVEWKNIFIEWFRWSIKTTITIAFANYKISNNFCKFLVWQSYEDAASTTNTTNIALWLLNEKLNKDYWVSQDDGSIKKLFQLSWNKKDNLEKKSVANFDTSNGVKIRSSSLWKKLRGALSKNARPDFLIIDDIDVSDSVTNPEVINKNYEKITGETFGSMTKDGKSQIMFLWNTITNDGIVPRFRKDKANAKGWRVFHQPLFVWGKKVWDFIKDSKIEEIKEDEWMPAFNQNYMLIPLVHLWTPVFDTEKVQGLPEMNFITSSRYKELRFFKKPCECVLWIDVAGGNSNWDYSTITAYDYNYEIVLTYQWKVAPDILWDITEYIFEQWYRWKIIPERNSIWLALLDKLKVWPCKPYLFFEKTIDKVTAKPTKKLWFSTNSKSKPLIISNMEKLIREWKVTEFDERTKQEIYNYYYDDKGATNALRGSFDDLVISTALCFFWLSQPRPIQFI